MSMMTLFSPAGSEQLANVLDGIEDDRLRSAHEATRIGAMVDAKVRPLQKQVADLAAQLAAMPAPVSGHEPSTLTGDVLWAIASDPAGTRQRLDELKAAKDAHDTRLFKVTRGEEANARKAIALAEGVEELDRSIAALKRREAAVKETAKSQETYAEKLNALYKAATAKLHEANRVVDLVNRSELGPNLLQPVPDPELGPAPDGRGKSPGSRATQFAPKATA